MRMRRRRRRRRRSACEVIVARCTLASRRVEVPGRSPRPRPPTDPPQPNPSRQEKKHLRNLGAETSVAEVGKVHPRKRRKGQRVVPRGTVRNAGVELSLPTLHQQNCCYFSFSIVHARAQTH